MTPPFPDRKYSVIYADPPWSYRDKREPHGGTSRHFATMTREDLLALPVWSIAAENCLLFMWATFPNLQQALATMTVWGFKYKTLGFSWTKMTKDGLTPAFGIGYYPRSNCEVCLLGVKGKPFKVSNSVSSAVISPRGKHSAKPPEVRDRIVAFAGDVPRIELFARERVEGWDAWGDEVPKGGV